MNVHLPDDGRTASTDLALSCLFEFAAKESKHLGGRPARKDVRGIALRDALEAALAGTGTDVVALDDLPGAVLESDRILNESAPQPSARFLRSSSSSVRGQSSRSSRDSDRSANSRPPV